MELIVPSDEHERARNPTLAGIHGGPRRKTNEGAQNEMESGNKRGKKKAHLTIIDQEGTARTEELR